MVETQPHAENKPADHRRRGKPERKIMTGISGSGKITAAGESASYIDVDDLLGLIRRVYSTLGNIGEHPPGPEAGRDHANYALIGAIPKNVSFPEKEEEEMAQIYQRIDRELAVEEARADRLLQQRASR